MKSSEKTDDYYTRIGLFLRKSNIDELPQLLNILNGTMSFIGPRPEMPFIVKNYNYLETFRLNVNPNNDELNFIFISCTKFTSDVLNKLCCL